MAGGAWQKATKNLLPMTTELMVELTAYRHALKMRDLPQPSESSPLLFPVAGGAQPIRRRRDPRL